MTKSMFRSRALLSGLVVEADLTRVEAALREAAAKSAGDSPATTAALSDQEIADKLVELGVVTAYQAQQLREGRTKFDLGPYIITDWIGQGGMGNVYKAIHKILRRECAVKVLPQNKSTPEAINNFTREIRLQAKLDHPNLVRAYDAGQDGNVHYMATEYVAGLDLRRLIRSQGPLTIQQAASVVMQAARGLDYAHQSGLIHRDVKPGNVLVTPAGIAKVSDLGLAGCIEEAQDDPRVGKIVGTPDYLSPEQIRNPHEVTKVTDIYSLGCTLYYAVTGKVPFPGGTAASKAQRIRNETPWHPRQFVPDISEEFVEVIADMMEKDPAKRIQSAGEVASRLEPWASDVSPIPSRQLSRSPWTAAPLPTSGSDNTAADAITEPEDIDSSKQESVSQNSQGTFPNSAAMQETKPVRRVPLPPPLPIRESDRRDRPEFLIVALSLAIPCSLALGVLLGMLLRGWMR
jgi:serine/threonine protein kinase